MIVNRAYPTDWFVFHILSRFLYVLFLVEAAKALQRFSFTDMDRSFLWAPTSQLATYSGGIPERL